MTLTIRFAVLLASLISFSTHASTLQYTISTFSIAGPADQLRVDANGTPFYASYNPNGPNRYEYDINASGEVVGTTGGGYAYASLNGTLLYSLQPFLPETQGYAINNNGDILVAGYDPQNAGSGPFAIREASTGHLIVVPISSYRAPKLNDSWDIVTGGVTGDDTLFIYSTGQIYNLASLVTNLPQGLLLGQATGINDALQIVGIGAINGQQIAWELTPFSSPVPEPDSLPMMLSGVVVVGLAVRRKTAIS